jgi:hypothetical protein
MYQIINLFFNKKISIFSIDSILFYLLSITELNVYVNKVWLIPQSWVPHLGYIECNLDNSKLKGPAKKSELSNTLN